ncbi:hypothetical protein ACQPW1_00305 [Nocardia sp. CA-128927]|uniref:hypothetical protein n=1 Tax=Nocardia sp. CA-128927 TaxID=3239975 RepID=UPI003D987153
MARHTDHDELAAEALSICAAVRELGPAETYRTLTLACQRDPERMAQVAMTLATWVDYDGPTSALIKRAEAIVESRIDAARAVSG